jgi:hypothetical protein
MVRVDLVAGGGDTEGRIVAVGMSVCIFVEGLTPRALVTLLQDLIASGEDVEDRLLRRPVCDHQEQKSNASLPDR